MLRMLRRMWVLPLVAAVVAFVFAIRLAARYARKRHDYQLAWALALGMYGLASLMVVLGVARGWTSSEFAAYWALGAVLNVPFLAGGEVMLLARSRTVDVVTWLVLIFIMAYTVAVVRDASVTTAALLERLPSGKDVFGDGSAAHRLPQLISIPSYAVLLAGTLWSAWTMRGRPDLRGRSIGTLLDRPRRHHRGRWRNLRGVREPRRLLRDARGGDRRDVRRVPASVVDRVRLVRRPYR